MKSVMGQPRKNKKKHNHRSTDKVDAVSEPSIPQNPMAIVPPAAPLAAQPIQPPQSNLEQQKGQLEVEKLREEIADIRNTRRWSVNSLRKVKVNEWALVGAAFVALIVGWRTGLFDAIRQHLAAQQERLQVEKVHLEQQKEKLTGELGAKQKELDAVKARLTPFEQEGAAVRELREFDKRGIQIRFLVTPEYDGTSISLRRKIAEADFNLLVAPKIRTNPYVTDALKSVNRMRDLKGLKIGELPMVRSDVQLATHHSELETLVIDYGELGADGLAGLRPLPKCRVMVLRGNKITTFVSMPSFPSVTILDISENPFGDDALASLVTSFPNLQMINLGETTVSDDGMKTLTNLRDLNHINLRGTRVTGAGGLRLLDCPKLMSVDIDKDVVNDEQRAIMRKHRPNFSGFLHKQGRYRWDGDW